VQLLTFLCYHPRAAAYNGVINFGQYAHVLGSLTVGANEIYGSTATVNIEGSVTVLQTLTWNRGTVSCPLEGGQLINNGTAALTGTASNSVYDYLYAYSDKVRLRHDFLL
jgi:hypothetical protein